MSSSPTAYFLDFDHTLFNTDEFFHVDVRNAFLCLGVDATDWERSYAAVWPTGYSLEKQAEEVFRRSGCQIPIGEMKRILQNSFSDLRRYLFPDVFPFLQAAKDNGVRLFLLSFGEPEWQRYKASASRVDAYFDDMFFTAMEGGKARLIQQKAGGIPERAAVVDNDPNELDGVRDLVSEVRTYWINRVPDPMRFPTDELSERRFLEARRYLDRTPRHPHVLCKSLDSILFEAKDA